MQNQPLIAKVLNATSNLGGLLLFIIGGKVIWATGFVMMAGQFIGARAGSRAGIEQRAIADSTDDRGRVRSDECETSL
ncbi:Uncharacterised protein [Raoultella terrigena]|uniref:Uncharacterized protein n=1 Tax=Raoultella terrigena TaxID=577 RepID=A0A3P8M225_RAOTE|nr:Uncharacterised protein [Raoultella terrigena]